jgi:hypothetical protein
MMHQHNLSLFLLRGNKDQVITQHPLVQPSIEPNINGSDNLPDPALMGSGKRWVQA